MNDTHGRHAGMLPLPAHPAHQEVNPKNIMPIQSPNRHSGISS
ncbi:MULTISPECIES: hypothetical protein [unclassified Rhizobium]